MNALKSIHAASICSAALAVVASLANAGEVPAATHSELRSATVSYRDVNLSAIDGAMTLYQRLQVQLGLSVDMKAAV
jgi:UrcA family protein